MIYISFEWCTGLNEWDLKQNKKRVDGFRLIWHIFKEDFEKKNGFEPELNKLK